MKIAFFSSHTYDIDSMKTAAKEHQLDKDHEFIFHNNRLDENTALLARGCEGVVMFVNDTADEATLRKL